jgi:putative spermidine/putrescine transport system substrate-binding protein
MQQFTLTRRSLLVAAGAAALTMPSLVRAQPKQVVVGTWGGDYAKLLESEVAPLLAEATGDRLLLATGDSTARRTKMLTAARVGAGDMDVACLSDSDTHLVSSQGLLVPVADLDIPNAKNIFETFRSPYSVPHIYSGMVIVYDKSQVDKAPTSVKDLWSAEYKGKVGFSDILFVYNLMSAAMAFGGSRSDFAPGRLALMQMKADGGARVYSSNEAIANAFHAKEIKATLMWKARAVQWQDAGLSVEAAVPSEGAIPVTFQVGVTSFASNRKGAAATLNAFLDPKVQLASAKIMGYLPTVSNAPVPDDMRQRLGFTDAQRESFASPDYDYIAAQLNDVTAWWNQSFKA